ncbi:MAG: DUF2085 domain-containing protein, partial [Promethearchaeota archaeon]
MEKKYDHYIPNRSKNEKYSILRIIFLNLFISFFIISIYFYLSENFGSISTDFIENSGFNFTFGITLLIFIFFSILADSYHGFIAGFIGELLYQIAFYDKLYLEWCFIIGFFGFLVGCYKYKPLKYQNRKEICYMIIILLLTSLITASLIILNQYLNNSNDLKLSLIIINYGFKFLIQCIVSIVIIVPILLYIYDKALSVEEKEIYIMIFTHHMISESDHTIFLKFGRTKIYFCTRCSGVFIGLMVSYFLTYLYFKIYNAQISPEFAVLLCIILPIPGLIDWGSQRLLLRKSTTESRLFTGFIIGTAMHFLTYTNKYYLFMLFIVVLYFSIFGLLV